MTASETDAETSPRILRLRIRGFRSYGTVVREIELDSPITVIKGDNSQGKTATAEALEFLFTGLSSRRDLFGGAKAEYERMLTNVHLPQGDTEVWVEADFMCRDGEERTVRRTLTADYSASTDCESAVTIDAQTVHDLDTLGIALGEPPLAAPVLLQHNLRYVLSTAPQQRAAYFQALLELTDLDHVRNAVAHARARVAALPPLPLVATLSGLAEAVRVNPSASAALESVAGATGQPSVTAGLISAAKTVAPVIGSDTADGVIAELRAAKQQAEEKVFPIAALTPTLSNMPANVDGARLARAIGTYVERLRSVDAEVAHLAPIFEAVVSHPHLGNLSESTTCPVCEEGTLGPGGIQRIRDQLVASADVQAAASDVTRELHSVLTNVANVGQALRAALPAAQDWDDQQWNEVAAHRDDLLGGSPPDGPRLNSDESAREAISRAGNQIQRLRETWSQVKTVVDHATEQVRQRSAVQDDLSTLLDQVNACIDSVRREAEYLSRVVNGLHEDLGEKLQSATLPPGTREILDLLEHRDDLHHELRAFRRQKKVRQRVDALGRLIQAAEEALLDERFDNMGSEIDRWWATLRPDELVRFGGVGRRASGRRYVNLTAELSVSDEATTPQVRDAVGVFSDSQLNALGLAAFLARQRLLNSPVVVLDDPLPGYDPDHQVTFAASTITELLDDGVQVILLTHDPKIAGEVVGRHQYRDLLHYRLALHSIADGTDVTNEDDFIRRKLVEAQGHIKSQTVEGRKAAASALRDAAERLGKQIVAAARTANGRPTTVASLGKMMLGQLIPEVLPHVRGKDEPGRWNSWKNILNPGSHDDEPPSGQALGVALGEIKKVRSDHEKHCPGGLPK